MIDFITRQQAKEKILATAGAFFAVDFVKRSTGEIRRLTGRLGVKKYLAAGPAAYTFNDHNLISVFDTVKMEYRAIPVEGLVWLSVGGSEYYVRDEA